MTNDTTPEPKSAGKSPSLIAYQVRQGRDDQSSFWDRIGVAWANKDGGFTVQLHSVPLDGRIVLTKPKAN